MSSIRMARRKLRRLSDEVRDLQAVDAPGSHERWPAVRDSLVFAALYELPQLLDALDETDHVIAPGSCPKCGNSDVATSYHRGRSMCEPWSRHTNSSADGEHLHLACRTCSYDWTTEILVPA